MPRPRSDHGPAQPALAPPVSRLQRAADRNAIELDRAIGSEIRQRRTDAGVSLRAVATAAGISATFLCDLELGQARASSQALVRIAAALGCRLGVRLEDGIGPPLRDHLQAAILQALIAILHPRWRRLLEVAVYRPVRGVVDLVLDDATGPDIVAAEVHSRLPRIEQQVRWANAKADALAGGGAGDLSRALASRGWPVMVSRLLVLRNAEANRRLATSYPDLLSVAYPGRAQDAFAALTTSQPGPAPPCCGRM